MSGVTVKMSVSLESALRALTRDVVIECGKKYGFDGESAIRELGLGSKKGVEKRKESASIPLPFTGTVRDDCCGGVKQNHGLYTQCPSHISENGLCKSCSKQASKNASGAPNGGLIADRVKQGDAYRDPKGRAPVHYTKVMKKLNLSEEQVKAEAAKFNIAVDDNHFSVAATKRGRPKKATTSDTESDASTSEKKARGRPKKAPKAVEVSATTDLFASLMEQAKAASPKQSDGDGDGDVSSVSGSESGSDEKQKTKTKTQTKTKDQAKLQAKEQEKQEKLQQKKQAKEQKKQAKEQEKLQQKKDKKKTEEPAPISSEALESESESEEPVVAVKKFTHNGATYLRSIDNILYDSKTQDVVGKWNESTKKIEVYEDSDDEEEEDDA